MVISSDFLVLEAAASEGVGEEQVSKRKGETSGRRWREGGRADGGMDVA